MGQWMHGQFGNRLSPAKLKNEARILADGDSLKVASPGFTIVREGFAKDHPELVVKFLQVYQKHLNGKTNILKNLWIF